MPKYNVKGAWTHDGRKYPKTLQHFQNELTVLTLQWPKISLKMWRTNETYESFFKRQIASTVSNFCEQQANDCRGALLRVEKVSCRSEFLGKCFEKFFSYKSVYWKCNKYWTRLKKISTKILRNRLKNWSQYMWSKKMKSARRQQPCSRWPKYRAARRKKLRPNGLSNLLLLPMKSQAQAIASTLSWKKKC